MNNIEALAEIEKLKNGDIWIWPESDYGRAEIVYVDGSYRIYEIPIYGGVPSFAYMVDTPQKVVDIVGKWT